MLACLKHVKHIQLVHSENCFFSHWTFQQSHKLVVMVAWIYRKQKCLLTNLFFFLLTESKKPNIIRNYQMWIIQSPFLCRSLIKLLCTMPRLHLSLLRQTLDLLLSVGQVCHENVCLCVSVCVCVGCRAWLLATETQITPKILCANLEGWFSPHPHQVFSLWVPGGIWEHLLNDPEWCSRGSMWAAGV